MQDDYYANATIKILFSASFSEPCSIYLHSLSLMDFSDKKERINVFIIDPRLRKLSMRSTTATEIYKIPSHPISPCRARMASNAPVFKACSPSLTSPAIPIGTPKLFLTVLCHKSSPKPCTNKTGAKLRFSARIWERLPETRSPFEEYCPSNAERRFKLLFIKLWRLFSLISNMQICTEISAIQERLHMSQTLLCLWKMQKYQTEQSHSKFYLYSSQMIITTNYYSLGCIN